MWVCGGVGVCVGVCVCVCVCVFGGGGVGEQGGMHFKREDEGGGWADKELLGLVCCLVVGAGADLQTFGWGLGRCPTGFGALPGLCRQDVQTKSLQRVIAANVCNGLPYPVAFPSALFATHREHCQDAPSKFLQRCFYQAGPYDTPENCGAALSHSVLKFWCCLLFPANRERCQDAQSKFLKRCFYQAGPYDTPEGFQALSSRLDELESHKPQANRMFFLSIPPNVFLPATGNAADYARSK